MKHSLWKYALRMGVLACVLSCLLAVSALAGEERWGYQQLEDDDLERAYESLQNGIKKKKSEILLDESISLDNEQLSKVNTMLRADYPEYFWYTGSVSLTSETKNGVTTVKAFPEYVHASRAEQFVFEHEVEEILLGMRQNLGETADSYEKALYLHDVLAQHIVYDLRYMNEQSAYTAIVEGRAVCAGYARAYQYLLNRAGIDAWTVEGWSAQPGSNNMIGHAWNLVWLDGKCVYTDVTWDDQNDEKTQEQNTFHSYFNRSLAEMNGSHVLNAMFENALPDPDCKHTGMDYFTKSQAMGVIVVDDTTDAQDMVDCMLQLNEDGAVHYLWDIWYTGTDFNRWLDQNGDDQSELIGEILSLANAPAGGYGIAITSLGGEIQLEVYHASGTPVGWPEEVIEYDHDTPYLPEGEYELDGDTLSAQVVYYGSDLKAEKCYTAWVAYYSEDGALVSVTPITLALDENLEGALKNIPCPAAFDHCRVFVVGEAGSDQISPLCAALDLAKK